MSQLKHVGEPMKICDSQLLQKWHPETRQIRDLVPNPMNPRRMSKKNAKKLEKSLQKFGLCQPIVINTDDTIINGHQRLQALKALGYKECTVCVADEPFTEKEKSELGLLLNKITGEDNFDMLANLFEPDFLVECGYELEELDLDDPEEGKPDKKKKYKITITASNENDLVEIEKGVSDMLEHNEDTSYKVKIS